MKKTLILMMILSSIVLFTGCESKTDKLENKLNELESTVQDMSTSTTTTTTSALLTSKTTKTTKKKTTTTSASTSKFITSTTKSTRKTTKFLEEKDNRKYRVWYDDDGHMIQGYEICDDNNVCKCYFDNGTPKDC